VTTSESKGALKLPREAIRTAMYIDGRHHANAECEFIARKRSGHGVPVTATARPRPHVDAAMLSNVKLRCASEDNRDRLRGTIDSHTAPARPYAVPSHRPDYDRRITD